MAINPELSVIYGEVVLSLYPILIKTVPTSLYSQVLARFLVFPALALAFGPFSDFKKIWGNPYEAFVGILHGFFNLGHVFMSYLSYKLLPAGTAVSLFYLYPIFNVIIGIIAFNESYPAHILFLIPLAILGTYLVATSVSEKEIEKEIEKESIKTQQEKQAHGKQTYEKQTNKRYKLLGIIAALLSAITESVIFFFIRSNSDAFKSPFYTVDHLYPAGLAALLMYGITRPEEQKQKILDSSPINWIKLLGFNALLGFTGYIARFYGLPKISTVLFSLLSFVGVISAYIWGSLFADEKITKKGVLGSGLIALSIGLLRYFGTV